MGYEVVNREDRRELEDLRNIVFTMSDDNAGRTPPTIMYGPVTLDNLRLMMKYGG